MADDAPDIQAQPSAVTDAANISALTQQPEQRRASAASFGRPALLDLIGQLAHPSRRLPPGPINTSVQPRPPSRWDAFENFLGHFLTSFATGMQAAGTGPGANIRGAGAAMMAPRQMAIQQHEMALQQQQVESKTQLEQAQAKLAESQAEMVQTPWGPMPAKLAGAIMGPMVRGAEAAKISARSREQTAAPHTVVSGNDLLQWMPETRSYKRIGPAAAKSEIGKVDPIIEAQLGPFPKDPAKQVAWGQAAEAIKNRMAAAQGASRGQAYGQFRPVQTIDPETGELKWAFAKEAIAAGAAPAGAGMVAGSKEAQFKEIESASTKARSAIQNLDRDFSPAQRAKLILAMDAPDVGLLRNMRDALLGTEQLTPKQQDFVIWATQLQERALSLRSIAGMGQGAEDLRNAIRATLPGIRSANKEYALKQLDAFDQQVSALKTGVPHVRGLGAAKGAKRDPLGILK